MEYESLSRLNNNLYQAKKNGRWGIIDENNLTIVPFDWTDIRTISGLENYLIVRDNSYPSKQLGIYSITARKLTVPCIYNSLDKVNRHNFFKVKNGAKYNIVDINNQPKFKTWYDELIIPKNGRNFYIVKTNNRYGVIDDNEQEVVPIEYQEISKRPYSDGSYLAKNKDGKYGFMLLDGRITLPFEYDNLTTKYNDNVVSVQNGQCGLVQVNSGVPYEIVICNYDDIRGVSSTFILEKDGKYGLLDEYGKLLTEIEYQSLEVLNPNSYQNLIIKAKKDNDQVLLLDEQGKLINNEKYKDISVIINKDKSNYYRVNFSYLKALGKNKKYRIIDKVGTPVTKPLFDDVLAETNNMVTVKSKGKYGLYYILDQKMVVDYQYDQIVFAKGYFIGVSGKTMDFLYTKSGQLIKKVPGK
ncbi:MAG: WG repeat-containing protein [Flammeovirgaceae bacterium]|nr:WG repeat-containing protein [Flammeovirgaceae bacterium]